MRQENQKTLREFVKLCWVTVRWNWASWLISLVSQRNEWVISFTNLKKLKSFTCDVYRITLSPRRNAVNSACDTSSLLHPLYSVLFDSQRLLRFLQAQKVDRLKNISFKCRRQGGNKVAYSEDLETSHYRTNIKMFM